MTNITEQLIQVLYEVRGIVFMVVAYWLWEFLMSLEDDGNKE